MKLALAIVLLPIIAGCSEQESVQPQQIPSGEIKAHEPTRIVATAKDFQEVLSLNLNGRMTNTTKGEGVEFEWLTNGKSDLDFVTFWDAQGDGSIDGVGMAFAITDFDLDSRDVVRITAKVVMETATEDTIDELGFLDWIEEAWGTKDTFESTRRFGSVTVNLVAFRGIDEVTLLFDIGQSAPQTAKS